MKSGLAVLLLLIGAARHYGWGLVPTPMAGLASKGLGGVAILALLWIVWRLSDGTRLVQLVVAWWVWEELQVVLCTVWFAIDPWRVLPGQPICSAKVGIDLGAFGILCVAWLLQRCVSADRSNEAEGRAQ